ncbi:MAG: T9SS type A sorting domain-containing protein, partial [Ignavibacteriaceae bacterium]
GSNGKGNVGGVVNSTWSSTDGADNYILGNRLTSDVAAEGTYDFKLSFKDMGGGQINVGYSIMNSSYSLVGSTMDNHDPLATTQFNAINFAVSGTNISTTGLNITDVLVDVGSPVVDAVDNGNGNSLLPTVYSLSQNYPNPFNPTTTIKFGIPKAGDVSLAVYDILGRKVAELINGNLTAGYHTVNFNATNLASGVYFYRIEAGDFVSVKKLMLLK